MLAFHYKAASKGVRVCVQRKNSSENMGAGISSEERDLEIFKAMKEEYENVKDGDEQAAFEAVKAVRLNPLLLLKMTHARTNFSAPSVYSGAGVSQRNEQRRGQRRDQSCRSRGRGHRGRRGTELRRDRG